MHFISQFARKRDAKQTHWDAGNHPFGVAHKREAVITDIEPFDDFRQHLAAVGTGDSQRRPLIGHRGKMYVQFGPNDLSVVFQMR